MIDVQAEYLAYLRRAADVREAEGAFAVKTGADSNTENGVVAHGPVADVEALVAWFADTPAAWLDLAGPNHDALVAAGAEPDTDAWEMSAPVADLLIAAPRGTDACEVRSANAAEPLVLPSGPVIDHVGYLVRDLDRGLELARSLTGGDVDREVDRPQWSLFGYYVGQVEVFTFRDPELLDARLGRGVDTALDHIAYAVDDIRAAMARFPAARWSGPDLRDEATEPFDLGTALHSWTVVDGLGLQLLQYTA
jgi:catechol 2,3-dioxygenase-like lactoylglutathione lyase family enzyme